MTRYGWLTTTLLIIAWSLACMALGAQLAMRVAVEAMVR